MIIQDGAEIPDFDALLVPGRGINSDGTLSETSQQRAEVAAEIAIVLAPRIIVFSGGRSWRQTKAGEATPSEGRTMMEHAERKLGIDWPSETTALCEEDSISTVENFVNSKDMLDLEEDDTLAVLSDRLHFRFNRPDFTSGLVLPGTKMLRLELPVITPPTKKEVAEEYVSTLALKAFMLGVQRGDPKAIMRRQRKLERVVGSRSNPAVNLSKTVTIKR